MSCRAQGGGSGWANARTAACAQPCSCTARAAMEQELDGRRSPASHPSRRVGRVCECACASVGYVRLTYRMWVAGSTQAAHGRPCPSLSPPQLSRNSLASGVRPRASAKPELDPQELFKRCVCCDTQLRLQELLLSSRTHRGVLWTGAGWVAGSGTLGEGVRTPYLPRLTQPCTPLVPRAASTPNWMSSPRCCAPSNRR